MDLRIPKLGTLPKWEDGLEAQQQLLKAGVVFPCRELGGFEAIGELLVGHESLLGLVGAGADQWKPEVVGEETNRIEENPLFSERACQQGMNLIDDKHANFKLPGERADAMP